MTSAQGRIRWGAVLAAVVLALIVAVVCGALGAWQWERARTQGTVAASGPAVPIAEVTVPGEQVQGIGTLRNKFVRGGR